MADKVFDIQKVLSTLRGQLDLVIGNSKPTQKNILDWAKNKHIRNTYRPTRQNDNSKGHTSHIHS